MTTVAAATTKHWKSACLISAGVLIFEMYVHIWEDRLHLLYVFNGRRVQFHRVLLSRCHLFYK